eukprot:14798579-Heterocapsa_arctica.AAC.1
MAQELAEEEGLNPTRSRPRALRPRPKCQQEQRSPTRSRPSAQVPAGAALPAESAMKASSCGTAPHQNSHLSRRRAGTWTKTRRSLD